MGYKILVTTTVSAAAGGTVYYFTKSLISAGVVTIAAGAFTYGIYSKFEEDIPELQRKWSQNKAEKATLEKIAEQEAEKHPKLKK